MLALWHAGTQHARLPVSYCRLLSGAAYADTLGSWVTLVPGYGTSIIWRCLESLGRVHDS